MVTPYTVAALMERHVPLTYLTEHGRYVGRIDQLFQKLPLATRAYAASFDVQQTLALARSFVTGKLTNLRGRCCELHAIPTVLMSRRQLTPSVAPNGEQEPWRISTACAGAKAKAQPLTLVCLTA